ncbi:hypothetical protein Dalk_4806 [Desulfatibacillum aliphaticivorans]|uniref:Uncharacterized protein n=1 Tax=Desulfatibacillum aliphaticivorans TaxID=218208 RepID=B8FD52_DESAL|nr:hypothetical protein [Desulfatibacillum aliphaticivorans]ACL06483.1 hypothetical protein Dalk_4806 [Desulfatibacillum aliphaticivorans]
MTLYLYLEGVETVLHGRTVFPEDMEAVRRNFLDLEGDEDSWTDPNQYLMYDHRLNISWQIDQSIPPFEIDTKKVKIEVTDDNLDQFFCLPSYDGEFFAIKGQEQEASLIYKWEGVNSMDLNRLRIQAKRLDALLGMKDLLFIVDIMYDKSSGELTNQVACKELDWWDEVKFIKCCQ